MNIPKRLLHKPVLMTWRDHVGYGPQWSALDRVGTGDYGLATFHTVGFLLHFDSERVTLGSTLDLDKVETGDITVFVRCCVTDIRELY